MTDCQMKACFTPAIPCSRYCSAHSLQLQRVRGYMAEAEQARTPASHAPSGRDHLLATLGQWLRRKRQ